MPTHLPLIQLRNGLTDHLTGQRPKMQMDLEAMLN